MGYIYIIRNCLLPLRNPLTIDNLLIFLSFDEAYHVISEYITLHKLSMCDTDKFNVNNRYYVYEDFIEEQFIWIERFNLS
jgi:hypothetical protein